MIGRLAAEGVKRVAVMTPGFVADCLETLEEIAIAGRATFLAAGGESFAAVPCLNDAPATTALLRTIIARETAGWP
jgi:ferrochelatase